MVGCDATMEIIMAEDKKKPGKIERYVEQNWQHPTDCIQAMCEYYKFDYNKYTNEFLEYYETCFRMEYKHYGEDITLPAFKDQFVKESLVYVINKMMEEIQERYPQLKKKDRGKGKK